MNKKGIFFTLIALLIITIFVFYFATQTRVTVGERMPAIKSRIISVNDFVQSLETVYLPRALSATSQRALHAIILEINGSKTFRDDLNEDLFNATTTGNITNLTDPNDIAELPLMVDNTITDWLDKLTNVSRKTLHLETGFTVNDIRINQTNETGPWFAEVTMNINYTVNSTGIAFWERRVNITTKFPIEGYIDPYFMIMLQEDDEFEYKEEYSTRIIKRTSVLEKNWNSTVINDTIENEFYFSIDHSPDLISIAPSFMMRFEGDISDSPCCGIATLINPNKLIIATDLLPSGKADKLKNRSFVDFEFWTNECHGFTRGPPYDLRLFNITGVSSNNPNINYTYFRLDNYHANILFASPDATFPIEESEGVELECGS